MTEIKIQARPENQPLEMPLPINENEKINSSEFDIFAENYDELLQADLAFLGKDPSWYNAYKIKLLNNELAQKPLTILDFGCGTGRNIPFIQNTFVQAKLDACDVSEKSIRHAKQHSPNVNFFHPDSLFESDKKYDLIIVSVVLHHIPADDLFAELKRMKSLLSENGRIAIFEHNPWNPITRWIISNSKFDIQAKLIPLKTLDKL